jgi:3,4-dihydroxy 2-butanone 4-phosphate synthase/GTP cyclohydrolase II
MVNFMATHAKGLICVALSKEIATRLELNPMVQNNNSSYETAFTISVDAKEASTGISAHERDLTIKLLASQTTTPDDLVKPGHIFPLIAKDGGVLVRTGHTEGSVDIAKLAGLRASSVICEIMNEDGSMARRDDLEKFAKKHNLKSVYISDLVAYRLLNEMLVKKAQTKEIDFFGMRATQIDFVDNHEKRHSVVSLYGVKKSSYVKFHNITEDREFVLNQKKFHALMHSIDFLKQNGGLLVFIDAQESGDARDFGIGAQILKLLGVEQIRLLTSQKGQEFVGLSGFGLEILEEIEI